MSRLASLGPRLSAWQPASLLLFMAAGFLLPNDPTYSLVFYALVLPLTLIAVAKRPIAPIAAGTASAAALILWSGLTLLWGQDDGHRTFHFAVDSAMTLVFLASLLAGLRQPAQRMALAEMLIWAGVVNALLAIALGQVFPRPTERLHGWGVTSQPILGATVMGMAFLTALWRALQSRSWRWPHLTAALAMGVFILMTESRGPFLAIGAASLLLCAAGRGRWWALGAVAALAGLWRLLPASMRAHHEAILVNRGSSHRFEIWQRSWQMIRARPVLGHGLAANLDLPGITFPHDLYLSVLFYSGAIGFVLFTLLALAVGLLLWRGRGPERAWLAALCLNTMLAGLTDLGQITKGPGPMWFIFWLPAGLVLAAFQPVRNSLAPSSASQDVAASRCVDKLSAKAQNAGP